MLEIIIIIFMITSAIIEIYKYYKEKTKSPAEAELEEIYHQKRINLLLKLVSKEITREEKSKQMEELEQEFKIKLKEIRKSKNKRI